MILAAALLAACHAGAPPANPEAMRKPIALEWKAGRTHEKLAASDEDAQAYYDQGLAYLDSFAWIPAAQSFQQALQHDPTLALAEYRLYEAYSGAGLTRDAEARLERARDMAKDGDRARLWVNAALAGHDASVASRKQSEAARQTYRQALDALVDGDPLDPRALMARGDAELAGPAEAIRDYAAAAVLDPESPGARHRLAHALERTGHFKEALDHARAYEKAAQGWPHAGHVLGHLLPRAGAWDEARSRLEEVREEDAHGEQLLAAIRLRANDRPGSETLYRSACRRGECGGLLRFLLWSGRMREVLDTAADVEPCEGETLAGFALTDLWLEGDPRKALKRARSACAGLDRGRGIQVEMLAALIDIRRGKGKKMESTVLRLADEAAALAEWDTWLFFLDYYSRALLHAGKGEMAAEVSRRVRRIDPGFEDR